jgi:hypothetical protein
MQSGHNEALKLLPTLCPNLRLKKGQWGLLVLVVGPALLALPVVQVHKATQVALVLQVVEVCRFQRKNLTQKTL